MVKETEQQIKIKEYREMYIQVITERGREGTETLSNEKSCTEEDVIVALSVGFMRLPS
jgi:hypothetical protein